MTHSATVSRWRSSSGERPNRFESRIRVDHYPWNVPDFQTDPQAKTYPFAYSADEIPDLAPSSAQAANSVCPSPLWGRGRTASSAVVHHSQSKERILRAISDRRAGN